MKKLFSILLCTAMVFSLAACGSANSSNTPAASTAPAASAANPASGADTQAETTAWAPTKDVEIVTHSGVGSGGDVIGRAIIESCKGIVDANMFMQNKKGNAGSAILCLLVVGSLALKRSFFADFFALKIAGIFAEYKNICFLRNDFLFPAEYINIRNNKSK